MKYHRNIRGQILEAAALHGIALSELTREHAATLRQAIFDRYNIGRNFVWIWDKLKHAVSLQADDGWSWIGDYAGENTMIVFFNDEDEPAMFEIPHGYSLGSIMGETNGFEFYCTDRSADYLICFNHHNYVLASGDAEPWLAARKLSLELMEREDRDEANGEANFG